MEKIIKLRKILSREKIDGYLIPKNNEFFSEYVPNCDDRLNYISNFSGSYGFSLVLKKRNYLFIDGRYTLQAKKQSGDFFKIITFPKHMPSDILKSKKYLIGFDPKLFTNNILTAFFGKGLKLKPLKNNLVDQIWKRRIKKSKQKFYNLPYKSLVDNYQSKINKVISVIRKTGADFQFITSSENNAWLLNIRGGDVNYSPIPHCYILIDNLKNINFFCDMSKISKSLSLM